MRRRKIVDAMSVGVVERDWRLMRRHCWTWEEGHQRRMDLWRLAIVDEEPAVVVNCSLAEC